MFLIKKVFLTGESKQAQIIWLLTWLMSVLFLSQDVYVHGVYMLLFHFIHQISFFFFFPGTQVDPLFYFFLFFCSEFCHTLK